MGTDFELGNIEITQWITRKVGGASVNSSDRKCRKSMSSDMMKRDEETITLVGGVGGKITVEKISTERSA